MPPTLALYVHGMGRTSVSGWPLLWRLKRAGVRTATFDYQAFWEDFPGIVARLATKIETLGNESADERFVVIGHSLGGVLARAALATLPPEARRPDRLFLLGSPVKPSRLAKFFGDYFVFRAYTRDCGRLLGSPERMATVATPEVPTTAVVGTLGPVGRFSPFGDEPNDGIVSVSEATAEWLEDVVPVAVSHTFLPASEKVASIVLDRLQRLDA